MRDRGDRADATSRRGLTASQRESARRLLAWYRRRGRKLPWRQTREPYKTLVAEVLLQQTQTYTATRYYERWLDRFPTPQSLASSDEEEILRVGEGIGYYRRLLNLQRSVRLIQRNYGGAIPRAYEKLIELPGVGPYTAEALRAFVYNDPALALDGNLERVLSRFFGIRGDGKAGEARAKLRRLGLKLVASHPRELNQALMDLGALVCLPARPRCSECPLCASCYAYRRDLQGQLPGRRPRRPKPRYRVVVAVIRRGEKVLIDKRRPDQLLGGLWEFPGGRVEEGESDEAAVVREIIEEIGIRIRPLELLTQVRHAYSHFGVLICAYLCRHVRGRPKPLACEEVRWVALSELPRYPMPAANRKIVAALQSWGGTALSG